MVITIRILNWFGGCGHRPSDEKMNQYPDYFPGALT
jgi:hypothetical protein